MNKNTDKVPAGVAALYADIPTHPVEAWRASGSELPYLEWVEGMKAAKKKESAFRIRVTILENQEPESPSYSYPVVHQVALLSKSFPSKAAAEKFVAELEDFA